MAEFPEVLNIAMVGHGFIAAVHSNAIHQVRRFFPTRFGLRTQVVCGRDRASLQAMADRWGWQETAVDWQTVIERDDIHVVDIATPNILHAPIAIAAAKAGKIVWCEKPLATTLTEAADMAEATKKVPTLVWFNYRRIPAVVLAKQMIEQERLGEIFHYRALYLNQSGVDPAKATGWRYRLSEAGSGASGDLLSHCLEMALYLNGEIEEVCASSKTFIKNRDVDDAVMLMARFSNGSIGTFEATRFGVGFRNSLSFQIHGSKGMLQFDLEDMNSLRFYDATETPGVQGTKKLMVPGPDQPYAGNFWKPGHPIGFEHTFIATLGDFLSALQTGTTFHPNFNDGLKVQKLLEAISRSSETRSWQRSLLNES
jgi:predicted dehydrogenase